MSESNITEPIVHLAEDPAQRNRILIAVSCSIVGAAIIAALSFFLLRRKEVPSNKNDSGSNFPPTQPCTTGTPEAIEPVSDVTETKNSVSEAVSDPLGEDEAVKFTPNTNGKSVIDEILLRQKSRRLEFKTKQESFRQRRDERRKMAGSSEPRLKSSPASPVGSGNELRPEPGSKEERDILQAMEATREMDRKTKGSFYRDLLLRWHPDKRLDNDSSATSIFQFIQASKGWFFQTRDTTSSL